MALAYAKTQAAQTVSICERTFCGSDRPRCGHTQGEQWSRTYKEIIKIRPGQKAIIASEYAKTKEVEMAQELGTGKYIKKPYTMAKVGLSVKEELEKQAVFVLLLNAGLYNCSVKKFSSDRAIPLAAFRCGRVSPRVTERFSNPTTTLFQYWAVIPDIVVLVFLAEPAISPTYSIPKKLSTSNVLNVSRILGFRNKERTFAVSHASGS